LDKDSHVVMIAGLHGKAISLFSHTGSFGVTLLIQQFWSFALDASTDTMRGSF